MDAIDVALIDISTANIELKTFKEYPLKAELKARVRKVNKSSPISEVMQIDILLGREFADAANHLIDECGLNKDDIAAIGSHGQTVLHAPEEELPYTLQIANPNIIASKTGITTIADFRSMDVAMGGQGAPLAPLFHQALFASKAPCLVLNIGGISNLTILDGTEQLIGFDTGPGNGLMDDWIHHHKDTAFDSEGEWAKSGTIDEALLARMLDDDYFSLPAPKSTGRDAFNLTWIEKLLADIDRTIKPVDVQTTLLELTVRSIQQQIEILPDIYNNLIICGGGVKNAALITALKRSLSGIKIFTTDETGTPSGAIEAMCFAWLAYMRLNKTSLSLGTLTGSDGALLLGAIYDVST